MSRFGTNLVSDAHGITAAALAKSLRAQTNAPPFLWGVVQAVEIGSPSTLQITLGASTSIVAGVAFFSGYLNPTPGDKVLILNLGQGDLFVLGDPFTTAGQAAGGTGVSWPLEFSGDMGFRPDGMMSDLVEFSKSAAALFIDGSQIPGVTRILLTSSTPQVNFAVNDSSPGHESGPTVAISNEGGVASLQVTDGTGQAQLLVGPQLSGTKGLRFGQAITNLPDSDLNNSEFSLWLDDTPGATKLNIKAKDSGGTVRTASITLT